MNQKRKILLINFVLILIILFLIFSPQKASALTLAQQLDQHVFIKDAWKYVLAFLNAIVVLGLIIIALANILRLNIETYHIKRMLPSIIVGVILANFSYLICRVFVDFAQIMAGFFLDGTNPPQTAITGMDIAGIFGFTELGAAGAGAGAVGSVIAVFALGVGGVPAIGLGILFALAIAVLIIIGIPTILILILGFLLAVRIYLIWFLVIVSPIAFFSLLFTPLQKVWQTWWSWFIKWCFMAPIAFFFIRLAEITYSATSATLTGSAKAFGQWFFGIVLFCLAIYIPYMLGDKIVAGWANLWKGLARGGFKGLRYAGVGAGGAMRSWGERRNTGTGRFIAGLGNTLQRTAYFEDMKRELQRVPGGLAASEALASQEAKWARERTAGGTSGAIMKGLIGEKEKHKILENTWSSTFEKFSPSGLQGFLGKEGFKHIALSEEEIKKRAGEINRETKDPQMSAKVIGARRRMEGLLETSPTERALHVYQDAFTDFAGVDLKTEPIDEENDPDWLKAGKKTYLRAQQITKSAPGVVTGRVMPPEGEPPGGGLSYAQQKEHFNEWRRLQGKEKTKYEQKLARLYNVSLDKISTLTSVEDLSRLQSEALGIKERTPNFAAQAERVVPYITRLKQEIEVDPATVGQVATAVKKLEAAGGAGAEGPVINESVEVLRRISPKVRTEIDALRENPGELLNELRTFNDLGQTIRQNPTATNKTIQQQVRIKLTQDYQVNQISRGVEGLTKDKSPEQIAATLTPDQMNIQVKPKIRAYLSADPRFSGLDEGARKSLVDRATLEITDQIKRMPPDQIKVDNIREVVEKPLIRYSQAEATASASPAPGQPAAGAPTAEKAVTVEKPTPSRPAPPKTGGGEPTGGGAVPSPKPPAETKPPAAGVEVTPRTIPELDAMIGEERKMENPNLDRIATLTKLRGELQQKGKRG